MEAEDRWVVAWGWGEGMGSDYFMGDGVCFWSR